MNAKFFLCITLTFLASCKASNMYHHTQTQESLLKEKSTYATFVAKVTWIEPIVKRHAEAIPTSIDPNWLVGIDILSITQATAAFNKEESLILAIHSPAQVFLGETESILGHCYSFNVEGRELEGRVTYLTVKAYRIDGDCAYVERSVSVTHCNHKAQRLMQEGDSLRESDSWERGAPLKYEQAANIDKQCIAAIVKLGDHYYSTHQEDKALNAWNNALVLDPNLQRTRWQIATIYMGKGDEESAIRENKKVLEINPSYNSARTNLAASYQKLGLLNQAEEELKKVDPDQHNYANLGGIYFAQGRWDEAIEQYELALSEDLIKKAETQGHGFSSFYYAFTRLDYGKALKAKKRYAEAKKVIEQALPDFLPRHVVYEDTGIRGIRRGIPEKAGECHYELASIAALQGKKKEAKLQLQEAISWDSSLKDKAKKEGLR